MHLLTFDIEDWFHTHENRKHYTGHSWEKLPRRVEPNTHHILNTLDTHNRKATFFILGWIAQQHPALVKEIHARGHEIGSHSYWHHNASLLKPKDFETDLKKSLNTLETITGEKVISHRAPGFSMRLRHHHAFEILASQGITIDSSVQLWHTNHKGPFSIPTSQGTILEFPLLKTKAGFPYTGGGYFRTMPIDMLNKLFTGQKYRLLYFHPRDFDPENPYTNMFSLFRNKLNSINTHKCMSRLEQVLSNYPSHPLNEAAELIKSEPIG